MEPFNDNVHHQHQSTMRNSTRANMQRVSSSPKKATGPFFSVRGTEPLKSECCFSWTQTKHQKHSFQSIQRRLFQTDDRRRHEKQKRIACLEQWQVVVSVLFVACVLGLEMGRLLSSNVHHSLTRNTHVLEDKERITNVRLLHAPNQSTRPPGVLSQPLLLDTNSVSTQTSSREIQSAVNSSHSEITRSSNLEKWKQRKSRQTAHAKSVSNSSSSSKDYSRPYNNTSKDASPSLPRNRKKKGKVVPDFQPEPILPLGFTKETFFTRVVKEARKPVPKHVVEHILEREDAQSANAKNSRPVIPVVVWPLVTYGSKTAEHGLIEENGIDESTHLQMARNVSDFSHHVVWVADVGWGWTYKSWCGELAKAVLQAQAQRYSLSLSTRWLVLIVDFTDGAVKQRCRQVEMMLGGQMVQYTTRALAIGRQYNEEQQWVNPGNRLFSSSSSKNGVFQQDGTTYRHTPLIVRTDTVESMQQVLHSRGQELWNSIEEFNRPWDVAHFWPTDGKSVSTAFAQLRTQVSHFLQEFVTSHSLQGYIGLAGKAGPHGRRDVHSSYVETMLDTKLLVVTQRDIWEDHYRLMEAMVSGACVMTDYMHGLPAGLENGTSILVFTSARNLQNLILHYLKNERERIQIAKRGRRVAMSRHRSWHRMEEIVFGKVLTTCNIDDHKTRCPYIAHVNETNGESTI